VLTKRPKKNFKTHYLAGVWLALVQLYKIVTFLDLGPKNG